MKIKITRVALTLTVLAALSGATDCLTSRLAAAIVFDGSSIPVPGSSTFSQSDATGQIRAEDFVLGVGATTVTGVEWTGSYTGGNVHLDDDFTIQFFENAPPDVARPFNRPKDLPMFIVSLPIANSNRTIDVNNVFHYSASFAPLSLTAGNLYWVSIFNDASDEGTPGSRPSWLWGGNPAGVTLSDVIGIRNQSNNWGSGIGFKLDFRLNGEPVPEPATITIATAAVLCVWAFYGKSLLFRNS